MPYGKSDYRIIDVTPTLDTSEYASGDALFNRAEIPAAVLGNGGCSELMYVTVNSKKASATNMNIVLFGSDQSMEAVNAAMDITAAEGAAANFLGWLKCESASQLDMGNFMVGVPIGSATGKLAALPFLVKADDDSTSVYFTVIIGGTVTYADGDLTFRFHFKQR